MSGSIRCLAENYCVVEKEEVCYVYNTLYEESAKILLPTLLVSLSLPEAADYYLPLAIRLKQTQSDVVIQKDLRVSGVCDAQYFIPRHQYETWKKVYRVVKAIFLLASILLNVLLIGVFWKSDFHPVMGICVGFVFLLCMGVAMKFGLQNHKRKKYEIMDISFEE